jgi:hypothetical protein
MLKMLVCVRGPEGLDGEFHFNAMPDCADNPARLGRRQEWWASPSAKRWYRHWARGARS